MSKRPRRALTTVKRTATFLPVTPMQNVVATLLGIGQSHEEIAVELGVSRGMVRDHINRLAARIPGDLPATARIIVWVRGASIDILEGNTLRFEMMARERIPGDGRNFMGMAHATKLSDTV